MARGLVLGSSPIGPARVAPRWATGQRRVAPKGRRRATAAGRCAIAGDPQRGIAGRRAAAKTARGSPATAQAPPPGQRRTAPRRYAPPARRPAHGEPGRDAARRRDPPCPRPVIQGPSLSRWRSPRAGQPHCRARNARGGRRPQAPSCPTRLRNDGPLARVRIGCGDKAPEIAVALFQTAAPGSVDPRASPTLVLARTAAHRTTRIDDRLRRRFAAAAA